MGCAQWEGYRMDVRRRLAMGKDVDRLVGITQNFFTLPPFLSIIEFSRYKILILAFLSSYLSTDILPYQNYSTLFPSSARDG
jgi:hypothetical protein